MSEIYLSYEMHQQGCAALSGVETALLQARITLGHIEIELQRAAREARQAGCATKDLEEAVTALRDLSKDLLTRRACVMELHRDFRYLDDNLTPIRPSSDSALAAFKRSSNFPGKIP